MKQILVALLLISLTFSLNNGHGKTPAMGWASYESFGCDVNEQDIRNIADKIVSLGLNQLGYEYVILQDCWQDGRDSDTGRIQVNQEKFPNGMKAVVDYVHEQGLKFGISSDAGTKTCEGYTGSLGYEYIDALTYTNWGVDYLEYTNCNDQGIKTHQLYQGMNKALESYEKTLYFTAVVNDQKQVEEWQPSTTNSWNNFPEFSGSWKEIKQLISDNAENYEFATTGAWNYLGELYIDGKDLSQKQQQYQFAFWSLLKSPLILNGNLLSLSYDDLQNISNPDVIAVNQDSLGLQGVRLENNAEYQIWGIPQSDDSSVILVWNTSIRRLKINVDFSQINQQFSDYGYPSSLGSQVEVRELLLQKDLQVQEDDFQVTLDSQVISMLKLTPIEDNSDKIYQ